MLKPLISKQEIALKVKETAQQIHEDYQDKKLVVLMVLKGAICLVADLIREVKLPLELQVVRCSSYGGKVRGQLIVEGLDKLDVKNKDVLIVDDIFDTGHTVGALVKALEGLSPRSIQSCVLLNKKGIEKATTHQPKYVLFDVDDLFVVGYGLDYEEQYRGLDSIYVMEES
jgi:hypoxanthine phosphoribosyltransferase